MAALPLTTAEARRQPASPRPRQRATSHTTELRLVPRRRRTAGLAVLFAVVLVSMMLGAAMLHTRLAERQLQIDELDQQVDEAHARFEVLRGQRAELRSPGYLSEAASKLGMYPAPTTGYIAMDKWALARTIASAGDAEPGEGVAKGKDPLDQFRVVKRGGSGRR